MAPRFVMFYPDRTIADDGVDTEVRFTVPRVWCDAPADGMQAAIVHLPDGRLRVIDSSDIYAVMQNGEPFGTNDVGPLVRSLGLAKYGLNLPNEEFAQVRERLRAYRKAHEETVRRGE